MIGARSSLEVAGPLASVVVTLGKVPLAVGKAVTVTVRVDVTVMVLVPDQDFVPQCALRGRMSGVRRLTGATRARELGRRGRKKKKRDFMLMLKEEST